MPITQDRIITIINHTQTLIKRIEHLETLARKLAKEINDDTTKNYNILHNSFLDFLEEIAKQNLIPREVIRTIEREEAHFEKNKKRNDLAKAAIKRWRERKATDLDFELEAQGLGLEPEPQARSFQQQSLNLEIESLKFALKTAFADASRTNPTIDYLTETQLGELFETQFDLIGSGEVMSAILLCQQNNLIIVGKYPGDYIAGPTLDS